jgi:hypothetical protein
MSTHFESVVAATRGWIVRITSRGKKSGTTVVGVGVGVGVDGGVGVGIGHGQKAKAKAMAMDQQVMGNFLQRRKLSGWKQ